MIGDISIRLFCNPPRTLDSVNGEEPVLGVKIGGAIDGSFREKKLGVV
jgi:hypothetical protein